MSDKQVRDYDKFMLRFPDGMRDAIAERAKRNGRSMNSEIVHALGESLAEAFSTESCEESNTEKMIRLVIKMNKIQDELRDTANQILRLDEEENKKPSK